MGRTGACGISLSAREEVPDEGLSPVPGQSGKGRILHCQNRGEQLASPAPAPTTGNARLETRTANRIGEGLRSRRIAGLWPVRARTEREGRAWSCDAHRRREPKGTARRSETGSARGTLVLLPVRNPITLPKPSRGETQVSSCSFKAPAQVPVPGRDNSGAK